MSDPDLRRTLRRCTAVLMLPLSLWPVLFIDWLHTTRAREFLRPALAFGDELGLLLLVGACGYLVASFTAGLVGGTDGDADAAEGTR